jgi:outer membrane protein
MNAMTRSLGAIFLAALLAAPAAALAESKIGVVKLARLFEEAPQALALQRSLTEEFAPRERDIRAKREELRETEEKLQQGEGFLSEDERRRLEQSFRDGQRDLQRAQNEFVEDLNLRRNERLGDIQRLVHLGDPGVRPGAELRSRHRRRLHPRERPDRYHPADPPGTAAAAPGRLSPARSAWS